MAKNWQDKPVEEKQTTDKCPAMQSERDGEREGGERGL